MKIRIFALLSLLCVVAQADYVNPKPQRHGRMVRGKALVDLVTNVPPDSVLLVPEIYIKDWVSNKQMLVGDICSYSNAIYVCVQSHMSQEGWRPQVVPALWKMVRAPGEAWGDIPEWTQPLGAHNVYNKGDKVKFGGKTWVSVVDGNVWPPGVYGWEEEK